MWQPIDTAPKDGRTLLLCVAGFEPAVGCWHNSKNPRWITGEAFDNKCENPDCFKDYLAATDYAPTHWMELPHGPKDV